MWTGFGRLRRCFFEASLACVPLLLIIQLHCSSHAAHHCPVQRSSELLCSNAQDGGQELLQALTAGALVELACEEPPCMGYLPVTVEQTCAWVLYLLPALPGPPQVAVQRRQQWSPLWTVVPTRRRH